MICKNCDAEMMAFSLREYGKPSMKYRCVCQKKSITETKSQEERIAELCDELKALLIRKNRDYKNSFSKTFAKRGLTGAIIRMEDKLSRLDNLNEGAKDSVGESVEDTLLDLSGYALLTLVEVRKVGE